MLPQIKNVKPLPCFTPTRWQTVILRNYGTVHPSTLASVLRTDEETVMREAARLGIERITYRPEWLRRGFISIIKNNWYLLPYGQLTELLGMDMATLDRELLEDDFLGVKLGGYKPSCDEVYYSPLTESETAETERLGALIRDAFIEYRAEPFDFYGGAAISARKPVSRQRTECGDGDFLKLVYGYSMTYGDTFADEGEIVPDCELEALRDRGINGIWMQGLLSSLSPYPFVKGLDEGYERRRRSLARLVERCKKYGIGVYLYLNEPRGIAPDTLTPQTEKLKGRYFEGRWSLCTEMPEVKKYLFDAVKGLLEAVPELSGIITITMSENMTNCHSRRNNTCPHCGHLPIEQVVPEVNCVIQRAIDASGAKTRLIANLWGWTEHYGWTPEALDAGIGRMDKKIDIMSVSEMGHIVENGKRIRVDEYAISRVGPCEETRASFRLSRASSHRVLAKVQVNNSWELATVPYLPVFELVAEHMRRLKAEGVGGLMLSWTLGGYPTPMFELVERIFEGDGELDGFYFEHFGDRAPQVGEASRRFSEGFRHFPHSIGTLYKGAQQLGPSNLLYPSATGLGATMVTFPFDDRNSWYGSFDEEEFLSRMGALLEAWEDGLKLLPEGGNAEYTELRRYAEVVYVSFKSMVVQIRFGKARDNGDRKVALGCICEEEELTRRLYRLASEDARVGYEASNHYYYTQNNFLEKLIDLDQLKRLYGAP